jgi:hypothetical protein
VRVEVSSEAAAFVTARGGRLWVWAERPAMCCAGSPAWMRAATTAPSASADAEAGALCLQRPGPVGKSGFALVPDDSIDLAPTSDPRPRLQLFFRSAGGICPDVLEIGMSGRRHPKVAAYWDGCLMAMV